METPSEKVIGAFCSLEGNPHWEEIRQWLRESLGAAWIESSHKQKDASDYTYLAGRSSQIYEIVNTIDKARKAQEQIRARERR